jgi:hypothetical protein
MVTLTIFKDFGNRFSHKAYNYREVRPGKRPPLRHRVFYIDPFDFNKEISMSSDLLQFKTASATIILKGDPAPTISYANGSFTVDTHIEGGPLGIVRKLNAEDRRALLAILEEEIKYPPPEVDPAVLKCFFHLLKTAVIPD